VSLQFAARYRRVDVKPRHLRGRLSGQGADDPDNFSRTVAGIESPFCGLSDLIEIRRILRKPSQARIGVGHDGHQRLVHLVSDRSGEFAHRRQPRHACEIRLGVLESLLCANSLGVLRV
jgi:hypothetical protein